MMRLSTTTTSTQLPSPTRSASEAPRQSSTSAHQPTSVEVSLLQASLVASFLLLGSTVTVPAYLVRKGSRMLDRRFRRILNASVPSSTKNTNSKDTIGLLEKSRDHELKPVIGTMMNEDNDKTKTARNSSGAVNRSRVRRRSKQKSPFTEFEEAEALASGETLPEDDEVDSLSGSMSSSSSACGSSRPGTPGEEPGSAFSEIADQRSFDKDDEKKRERDTDTLQDNEVKDTSSSTQNSGKQEQDKKDEGDAQNQKGHQSLLTLAFSLGRFLLLPILTSAACCCGLRRSSVYGLAGLRKSVDGGSPGDLSSDSDSPFSNRRQAPMLLLVVAAPHLCACSLPLWMHFCTLLESRF
ncbi:unnamed protein product [Amoebophrya sp. A25]|nr:unnamed protein product [Amoebophrya sp. A25]|eukprot:GSA25T00000477001.1